MGFPPAFWVAANAGFNSLRRSFAAAGILTLKAPVYKPVPRVLSIMAVAFPLACSLVTRAGLEEVS